MVEIQHTIGPTAVASRYTESAMFTSALLMLNCCMSEGRAGAIIVLTIIRLKPVADKTLVTTHLRDGAQSFGLSGSEASLKATRSSRPWLPVWSEEPCAAFSGSTLGDAVVTAASSTGVTDDSTLLMISVTPAV